VTGLGRVLNCIERCWAVVCWRMRSGSLLSVFTPSDPNRQCGSRALAAWRARHATALQCRAQVRVSYFSRKPALRRPSICSACIHLWRNGCCWKSASEAAGWCLRIGLTGVAEITVGYRRSGRLRPQHGVRDTARRRFQPSWHLRKGSRPSRSGWRIVEHVIEEGTRALISGSPE